MLTGFPFATRGTSAHFETEFPYGLGLAYLRLNAILAKPFSTSVLQVLVEVFATFTKICTRGRSTRAHALGFVTDLYVCLLLSA